MNHPTAIQLDPDAVAYTSCSPAPLRTGLADFPYIRLFGSSFREPPPYEVDLGLYESEPWANLSSYRLG